MRFLLALALCLPLAAQPKPPIAAPLQRYQMGAVPRIHIIVKNGNITLVGVVDNEGDKNLAGIAANGVPGAFKVNNELTVGK
jgi:hyperosmotically inducible protein